MRGGHLHIDGCFADLADLILAVSRAVQARSHVDPTIVQLTTTEINVMRYIDHHPDTSPSAVAAGTRLQRSNLSKALRGLASKGLVERRTDPTDSRQAVLRPTPRAAENLTHLRQTWAQALVEAAGGNIAADELECALAVLRQINDGLHGR